MDRFLIFFEYLLGGCYLGLESTSRLVSLSDFFEVLFQRRCGHLDVHTLLALIGSVAGPCGSWRISDESGSKNCSFNGDWLVSTLPYWGIALELC